MVTRRLGRQMSSSCVVLAFCRLLQNVVTRSYQCCPGNTGAVFPGKYRPVQYPQSRKYLEILGNINILLVFFVNAAFFMLFQV